jgi:DNA-binding CsgD family transcriptional regulator
LKNASLEEVATVINDALISRASADRPTAAPLLTRQEEKVLTLWMDGASNQKIAAHLSINGKTVYTYKRNIRMKLHMDTRFLRSYPCRNQKADGTKPGWSRTVYSLLLSFVAAPEIALPPSEIS